METSFSDQMDQDKLFPTLSTAQVARIAAHGHRRAIARGDVLMDVGDKSLAFFVVLSGEIQAVRQFLDRRLDLTPPARNYFAADLAGRLAPRVAGIPPYSHPEYVLEGIVVAKQSRL